jgi:ectoine hydroxylase-related dioxygenase (phytanoyl-CoA dioxygenase family)
VRVRPPDVRFFRRHGWLILRRAVPAARLRALTRAFDRLMPRMPSGPVTADGQQVIHVRERAAALQAWAVDRAVGRLVAELLGCRRVQLLQDVLLLKPPRRGQRIKWHQDYGYIAAPLDAPRAVSVRLALTAEDMTTGCLQVLDGSQARGLVDEPDEVAEPASPIELRPGDLSVHHCLTLHWSGENRSPRPRKTVILFAFDGDCGLDAARGEPAEFPTDPTGRLAPTAFPVMFERAAARGGPRRGPARR